MFREWLASKQFSEKTIKEHESKLLKFQEWKGANQKGKVSYSDLLEYINYLQENGKSKNTINERLRSIRHYYNYQIELGNYEINPAKDLYLKGKKKQLKRELLTSSELEEVYEKYEGEEKLLLGLLINQGLRKEELERIRIEHINLEKGTIYIGETKRSNARTLSLKAYQILSIQKIKKKEEELLLDKKLSYRINKLLKKLKRLNRKIVNAHQLRGSVISSWLQKENLRMVQYKAGHKYISSTEYYQRGNLELLRMKINEHHPLK